LVGGDTLDINVRANGAAHGLITTPGATRFYRSSGEAAIQRTRITLNDQARLEWLPLEAIAFNDCQAENHLTLSLAPQAEFMGWDVTAFGLPLAQQPFEAGQFSQHIEIPGVWLERGLIRADDQRLMNSPLGLAGQR
jgi:urease accessory protein